MFNPDDPSCRSGQAIIGPDWTFKIDGLLGTCTAAPQATFGRWTLKTVSYRGQNLIDRPYTFEQGQHYGNVEVVVTDRRTQVDLSVTDELGEPTRDYVVLAFPADKHRWTQLARYVRTYVPPAVPSNLAGKGVALSPMPPARFTDLPVGEYYLIALDDMDSEDAYDPAVLDRLVGSSTKVLVSGDAPVEAPLRRVAFESLVR
jgi:hypothetical protein